MRGCLPECLALSVALLFPPFLRFAQQDIVLSLGGQRLRAGSGAGYAGCRGDGRTRLQQFLDEFLLSL